MRFTMRCEACLAAVLLSISLSAVAEDGPLASHYGFKPVELFKLSERSSLLLTGDLNGDGLIDILVADDSHSRLDLLLQRKEAPKTKASVPGRSDVNAVENDWRYEHKKLPVDQSVASMTLGDFNGDGKTDIVYFGHPDQLVIRYQPKEGDWTEQKKIRVPDVTPMRWFIVAGDLDADGRDDLVILGKHETILFYQTTKGVLAAPKRLMNTSDKLGLAQIADLDGDGRLDLCYTSGEGTNLTLGARLQRANGQLGPEYIFDLEHPRAVTLKDVDGKPGHEILAIDSRTGRLKMSTVERKPLAKNELPERLIQFGFGKQGTGKDRDIAVGDFDGDGLSDLAVSDPDASRILFFKQSSDGGLDMGTPYPSLTSMGQIRAADLDGDGKSEIVVHSAAEKSLGISKYENGRLSFPKSIPTEVEVAAIELVDLDKDSKPEVTFISKSKKDRSNEYALQAMKRLPSDEWQPVKFGDKTSVTIELKGTPDRMMQVDVTGDDRPEFLIFQGSKPPQLFGINAEGIPAEIVVTGNFGVGTVNPGEVSICELAGKKGLLVSQQNFSRHMTLNRQKRWEVADQFNITESNARLSAGTLIDLNGDGELEVALIDVGLHKLRVLQKLEGTYQPWKEIDIGEFLVRSLKVVDLNGDKRNDLLLFGPDKFAVLFSTGTTTTLKELATFESQIDKVFPTDVVAGDLNSDGHIDLAITDTRSHFIEIVQYRRSTGLQHALYFRVYEQKSFRNEEDTKDAEPREAAIADVTGDGLADLILLSHDRLLVYPQDDGK